MRKTILRDPSSAAATQVGVGSAPPSPPSESEPSMARARVPGAVPVAWLDRLLVTIVDLPILRGERSVAEALVDGLAAILPHCAVGVCLAARSGSAQEQRQVVIKRLPVAAAGLDPRVDPARLFPEFAREYVANVVDSAGSTLHAASNDDELDSAQGPTAALVDSAAMALGRALAHARQAAVSVDSRQPESGLQQRMLQADKLATFGQIAASVVHELNNPLTSIVAYSEYLLHNSPRYRDRAEGGEDVDRLRRIHESATRMLRATRDLVNYARPSGGIVGPVVLHDVIDQSIAFCEHVLSGAGVRVVRRYGASVRHVRAVAEQLVQVFVNLLTNASQAAPAQGGQVVVTTDVAEPSARSQRAVILVEDNGAGISPEHLPHVFVPFFTTKQDKSGTGLGLSIVKSIVDSHSGAIRVESEPGRGTRFVIELPVSPG